MTSQPATNYARLSAAVVVAALVISATLLASSTVRPTVTSTITTTITTTSSFTNTSTVEDTSTSTVTTTESPTGAGSVTGTSMTNASDEYLTTCSVTGIGGFEFQVVSDSTGASVTGETVNAVDTLGCDIVGQPAETQTVYLDNFSLGQGGWLTPVFPSQAEPGGELRFTVAYQGETYNFTGTVPPIGISCVTLHVPSGNVTRTTTMNGPCT